MQFISLENLEFLYSLLDASPTEVEVLRGFLALENYSRELGGKRGYVIEREGKYRGLGQFDKPTWDAVSNVSFDHAGDPLSDLQSTLSLLRSNRRVFRNQFSNGNFTADVAYLYHNQGGYYAARYLRTNVLKWPNQSDKAISAFARARRDYV